MNQARDDELVDNSPLFSPEEKDSTLYPADDIYFQQEVQRLYRLTIYGRWLVVVLLWVSVGFLSLWGLRSEIDLWMQNFTWVAVRYGLIYNRLPSLGLALCIGMTASVLVWQSRNMLLGRPHPEQRRLEQQVRRIRQQGPSHPLWKWVRNS